jgi:hypothetical protein
MRLPSGCGAEAVDQRDQRSGGLELGGVAAPGYHLVAGVWNTAGQLQ